MNNRKLAASPNVFDARHLGNANQQMIERIHDLENMIRNKYPQPQLPKDKQLVTDPEIGGLYENYNDVSLPVNVDL